MSLVFEQVSYAYDDTHHALEDVSFTLDDGGFLGIIGHTGSGKSTIAQLADALILPTSGRVMVDGIDVAPRENRHEIRRHIGLVFQYPEQQLFASTVAEDVAFGPRNLGLSAEEVDRRVRVAIERVGFSYDEVAERSPFELSGGQQRRIALAGALAMEPRTLVLDEPVAGMDPATSESLRGFLKAFNDAGMTIVLISHSMEDVAELCSQVLVLDHGHVLDAGTPAEVFAPAKAADLRRINLGVPRATKFAMELAEQGFELPQPILTTAQLVDAIERAMG